MDQADEAVSELEPGEGPRLSRDLAGSLETERRVRGPEHDSFLDLSLAIPLLEGRHQ